VTSALAEGERGWESREARAAGARVASLSASLDWKRHYEVRAVEEPSACVTPARALDPARSCPCPPCVPRLAAWTPPQPARRARRPRGPPRGPPPARNRTRPASAPASCSQAQLRSLGEALEAQMQWALDAHHAMAHSLALRDPAAQRVLLEQLREELRALVRQTTRAHSSRLLAEARGAPHARAAGALDDGERLSSVVWLRCRTCDLHSNHIFVLDEHGGGGGKRGASADEVAELWCSCSVRPGEARLPRALLPAR
jgi:hypothetical protein